MMTKGSGAESSRSRPSSDTRIQALRGARIPTYSLKCADPPPTASRHWWEPHSSGTLGRSARGIAPAQCPISLVQPAVQRRLGWWSATDWRRDPGKVDGVHDCGGHHAYPRARQLLHARPLARRRVFWRCSGRHDQGQRTSDREPTILSSGRRPRARSARRLCAPHQRW
jgi:hypothetical protein